jgi:phosphodiesterase/alkaline phosphatase D-like protein
MSARENIRRLGLAGLATLGASLGASVCSAAPSSAASAPVLGQQLPVGSITRTTATVSAMLDPEGAAASYEVLYGRTDGYGQHTVAIGAGEGLGEETIDAGLAGLAPGTTYHYAFVASNEAGSVTGPDETFTTAAPTPPGVSTGGASNVALTTATVSGTVEPGGLETSYELDFGTDPSYGTSIYGEAGAGAGEVEIAVPLQDLAPETTYHYRLVAINSDGKTYGADETFATPVYSNPIVLPPALPLLGTPAIAFPTATEPTHKAAKKKTKKKTKKGTTGKKRKRGKAHDKPNGAKGKKQQK